MEIGEKCLVDLWLIARFEIKVEDEVPMTLRERTLLLGRKIYLHGDGRRTRLNLGNVNVPECEA